MKSGDVTRVRMDQWVSLICNCSALHQVKVKVELHEIAESIPSIEGGFQDDILYTSALIVLFFCIFVSYSFFKSIRFQQDV